MAGPSHYIMPLPAFDKPVKVLIVASPYYKDLSDHQIAGAKAEIEKAGATWEIIEVPGALEIPTAISIAERMSNFDGYVALGCVIRGETTHYDTVCNDSSRAIQLSLHLIALSRKWGRPDKGIGFTSDILLAQQGKTTA